MRRSANIVPTAAEATCVAVGAVRHFVAGKGIVENRIAKHYYNKSGKEVLAEIDAKTEKLKHPNPKNRKEAMAHLTQLPSYEYVADFQRWSNDMMAIYSDPILYSQDMAYHYHRIWKVMNPTRTGCDNGNDSFEIVKIHPK